jgi:predicted PurR-regulated permease PerM
VFARVFITIVIGMCMILIAEKLSTDFQKSAQKYRLSWWQKHMYAYALIIFWIAIVVFLLANSGRELADAIKKVPTSTTAITTLYNRKIGPFVPEFLGYSTIDRGTVDELKSFIAPTITGIVSETALFIVDAILIIPLMFYMYFRQRHQIAKVVVDAVPERYRTAFLRASRGIGRDLHEFFAARVLEGMTVGSLLCLGFYVAGVKGWLILGLIGGLLNAVPYLGPILGAIAPLAITLSLDTTQAALYVLLTIVITQTIDDFYLKPFMLSSRVEVGSLLSIILILVGTQLFGIMGTIFALPIYLVYRTILTETYEELSRMYKD